MKIQNKNFNILLKVVKLGFNRYSILYILSIISMISILFEIIAMSLLSSISGKHYIIFNDFLVKINPLGIFIIVLVLKIYDVI